MKYYFIKTYYGLVPFDNDCKPYNKLEEGEEIELEIKTPRNVKFHRKFFALIKLAFDNQENYTDIEELRQDLIKYAGFTEQRTNYLTGEIEYKHKSIAFAKMEEADFEIVYNRVLDVICELLGLDNEEIKNELMSF